MSKYQILCIILGLLILCISIVSCIYNTKYTKLKKSYVSKLLSTSSIHTDLSIEEAETELIENNNISSIPFYT